MKTSFTARLLVTALSVAALSTAARADDLNMKTMIPGAPQIDAESWVLIDYNSGKVLAENNADARRDPASLTKNDDQLRHWPGHEGGEIQKNPIWSPWVTTRGQPVIRCLKVLP